MYSRNYTETLSNPKQIIYNNTNHILMKYRICFCQITLEKCIRSHMTWKLLKYTACVFVLARKKKDKWML